mmetsp:Transcript_39133/g.91753  ORF Transcript_39133/g.91753 Transcript_39133/m.91753 type:complete len:230 (-) Transcript_39133:63-752(-)
MQRFNAGFESAVSLEVLAKLDHPNIVCAYDAIESPHPTIVMPLLDGVSLQEVLDKTPRLPAQEVRRVALCCLEALVYTHAQRIVHRDIKPANIMVCHDGVVKLADWDLATIVDSTPEVEMQAVPMQGAGTPAFMSPEACQGHIGPGDDLWAVAVVMFQCIMHRLPFPRLQDVAQGTAAEAPPLELRTEDTPLYNHLVSVVARALKLDKAERYETATEMLAAVAAMTAKK